MHLQPFCTTPEISKYAVSFPLFNQVEPGRFYDYNSLFYTKFAPEHGSGKPFTHELLIEMVEMGNFEEALHAVKEDFTEASALLGELQTNKQAYNSRLIEFSELEKIQTRIRYGLLEHLKSGVKARRNT